MMAKPRIEGKYRMGLKILVLTCGLLCICLTACGPSELPQESCPKPEGFVTPFKEYNQYNLFYFAINGADGSDSVEDSGDSENNGLIMGEATQKWEIKFSEGYVKVDMDRIPKAFAFDALVRLDQLNGEAVLASQPGNFKLVATDIQNPDNLGKFLRLYVFDASSGEYRLVATTEYDEDQDLKLKCWHHIVALYDGHFKGRIYVDGQVNTEGIARFELKMNQPINHTENPGWPRVPTNKPDSVLLGASLLEDGTLANTFQGAMDEIRFSDITRFRVNYSAECPPSCRPGDHGVTGDYYNTFHHPCASDVSLKEYEPSPRYYKTDFQYWRWASERMHEIIPFDYRMPYVQDVTDHSALVVWRRKCENAGQSVDSYDPEQGCVHKAIQLCYGEAGQEMSQCEDVYPEELEVTRDNYPDCQYTYKLENLRPSTWYHYQVVELKGELDDEGNCEGNPTPIEVYVEPLTDSEGNELEWDLKDCWPTGIVRSELTSDAHFKTAPLALEDQVEFLAFGDTGPLMCAPVLVSGASGELRACYWLEKQRNIDTHIWGKDVPTEIYKYTMEYAENPSFWLSPGDLAQTEYNDHVYEAYLFGMFNKVWWHSWEKTDGFYNGMMTGVPLYAAIGNHEWEADWPGSSQCKYSASEYIDNLFPPQRQFESTLNNQFMYDRSSYSFDYGNMHIVSLSAPCDDSCNPPKIIGEESPREKFDQKCYIHDWDYSDPAGAWAERQEDSLQITWLKRDLWNYKNDPDIWKIVMFHVPLYGPEVEGHPGAFMGDVRFRLARLFELADVDLILVGHRHHYHRTTTEAITDQLGQPIPDAEHSVHLVVGTGGYVADQDAGGATVVPWFVDDHIPTHVGVPRLWVDGNALFLRWYSLKRDAPRPPLEESCLFLKNVSDINKSECLNPGNFPVEPCQGMDEGAFCSYDSTDWSRRVNGRCLIPHTQDPMVTGGNNGSWGPGLRCIPLPSDS